MIKYWVSRHIPLTNMTSYEKVRAIFELLRTDLCYLPEADGKVMYPRNLLKYKAGNRYDFGVLYATALGYLEIRTVLALSNKEAIILFDQGDSTMRLQRYVRWSNRIWQPVHIQFSDSFDAACESGLLVYQQWQMEEVTLLDVQEIRQRYSTSVLPSPAHLYLERGVLYAQSGKLNDAVKEFESVLKLRKSSAVAHNYGMVHNYGNTFEYDISYILENPPSHVQKVLP